MLNGENLPQGRTSLSVDGRNSFAIVSDNVVVGQRYQITIIAVNEENLSSPRLSTEYHHGTLVSLGMYTTRHIAV